MASQDLMSINTVAAKLGLSVHQLRRWELMFGLEIKRGRGQQRQYRPEDLTVLERIKELVEQGWPTSQIRPQIEAEGLITPKIIGVPQQPGNPEVILESIIGFRNFCERRFIELSKQIDELRQLVISLSLKQELAGESDSPWQPVENETASISVEPIAPPPPQEIAIGPEVNVTVEPPVREGDEVAAAPLIEEVEQVNLGLGEVTDQNYLTVLGRALDMIGWTDEEADEYSEKTFGISHWDELGRSQAEMLVAHLVSLIREKKGAGGSTAPSDAENVAPAEDMSPASSEGSSSDEDFGLDSDDEGDSDYDEESQADQDNQGEASTPDRPVIAEVRKEPLPIEVQAAGRQDEVYSIGQEAPGTNRPPVGPTEDASSHGSGDVPSNSESEENQGG